MFTLEWKAIEGEQKTMSEEQLSELMASFGIAEGSRRALDYHILKASQLTEEEKAAAEAALAEDNDNLQSLLKSADQYNLTEEEKRLHENKRHLFFAETRLTM